MMPYLTLRFNLTAWIQHAPSLHAKLKLNLSIAILLLCCATGCFHAVEEIRPPESSDSTETEIKANGQTASVAETRVLPTEQDWPWWRGTSRANHAPGPLPPITWNETENVLWKAPVPGRGHASPILWGEQLWLTTAEEDSQTQSLYCFDRESGAQLWKALLHSGGWPSIHSKNSHASATPACDGERVFTVMANNDAIWVSAVDLEGKILWQTKAGPFQAEHGYGSSPVIHQGFLIVMSDNKNGGFVAALDRSSGEIRWRIRRARDDSYASPIVAHVSGKDQLMISGQQRVVSYNPLTGVEYWSCAGPADATANTMTFNKDMVFASGGYPQRSVLAIRGDGTGNVTGTHLLWNEPFKLYVPSPLVIEDRLLAVGDEGVATCFSISDGRTLWKKRMGNSNFSASPVLVQDTVYIPDERGKTYVFRADADKMEILAENNLADGGMASPVIVNGRVYLRTSQSLYCIGNQEPATGSPSE